jgi:hypothetical protein
MSDYTVIAGKPENIPEDKLLQAADECNIKIKECEVTISRMREQMESDPEYLAAKEVLDGFESLYKEATLPSQVWIADLQQAREELIARAMSLGIESQKGRLGMYRIKQRKVRKIIPALFYEKFGADVFVQVATIKIKDAEALVAKKQLNDVVETELQGTPSVEYKLEKVKA